MVDVEKPVDIPMRDEEDLSDTERAEIDDFSLICSEDVQGVGEGPAEISDEEDRPLPPLPHKEEKKKGGRPRKSDQPAKPKKPKKEKKEEDGEAEIDIPKPPKKKFTKRKKEEEEDEGDEDYVQEKKPKKKDEDDDKKKARSKDKGKEKTRDLLDQLRDKRRRHDESDERKERHTYKGEAPQNEEDEEDDSESEAEDTKIVPVTSFLANDYYNALPIARTELPATGRRSKFGDSFIVNNVVPVVNYLPPPPPRPRRQSPPPVQAPEPAKPTQVFNSQPQMSTYNQQQQQQHARLQQQQQQPQFSVNAYSNPQDVQLQQQFDIQQFGSMVGGAFNMPTMAGSNGMNGAPPPPPPADNSREQEERERKRKERERAKRKHHEKEKEKLRREKEKEKEKKKKEREKQKQKEKEKLKQKLKQKEKEKKQKIYAPLDPSDPQFNVRRSAFKVKISEIILKRLKKYHQAKRIASKEDFKHLARKFTHMIMEKEETKRVFLVKSSTEEKINKVIDSYFDRHSNYARDGKASEASGINTDDKKDFDISGADTSIDNGAETNGRDDEGEVSKDNGSVDNDNESDKDSDKEDDKESKASDKDSDKDSDKEDDKDDKDDKEDKDDKDDKEDKEAGSTKGSPVDETDKYLNLSDDMPSETKETTLDGSAEYSLDDYGE